MASGTLIVKVGLTRNRGNTIWPSEAGFITSINKQMDIISKAVEDIVAQMLDVTPALLIEVLEPTFEKSKEYCPKKTRALVNSAYLEVTTRGKKPRVEMGYAKNGNPRYGAMVHEMTDQYHEAPTRAKFLEQALKEDHQEIVSRTFDAYKRFWGSG